MSNYSNAGIIKTLDEIANYIDDFCCYFSQHPDVDLTDEEERAAEDVRKLDLLIDWLNSTDKVIEFGRWK